MSNLLKLLQPPTYKSKIKLYCPQKEFEIKKYNEINNKSLADVNKKRYICITEIR